MTRVESFFENAVRPAISDMVADICDQEFSAAERAATLSMAFSELSVSVQRHLAIALRAAENLDEPMCAELAELMQRKAEEAADEIRHISVLSEVGVQ